MDWSTCCRMMAAFVAIVFCVVSNATNIDSDVTYEIGLCEEENITTWVWYCSALGNGLTCHFEHPIACSCILSNKTVASNCDKILPLEVPVEATVQHSSNDLM